jgi:hypothetical protein
MFVSGKTIVKVMKLLFVRCVLPLHIRLATVVKSMTDYLKRTRAGTAPDALNFNKILIKEVLNAFCALILEAL